MFDQFSLIFNIIDVILFFKCLVLSALRIFDYTMFMYIKKTCFFLHNDLTMFKQCATFYLVPVSAGKNKQPVKKGIMKMSEFLELQMLVSGVCRFAGARELEKDGVKTGRSAITLRYEGGTSELIAPTSLVSGFREGEIVDCWLDVEPHDCGYEYDGRKISRPGFRVTGIKALRSHQFQTAAAKPASGK